jgi:hypothetical protein
MATAKAITFALPGCRSRLTRSAVLARNRDGRMREYRGGRGNIELLLLETTDLLSPGQAYG